MYVNQESNLDVLRGLSHQPPPVIEEYIQEVSQTMTNAFCITVKAVHCSISLRVIKYIARRLVLETKVFDDLIWVVIGHREVCGLSMKDFQLKIAQSLGVLHSKTEDGGGDDDVDEFLSSKIHECMKNRSFLLVQNGGWSLKQLGKMGIPISFRVNFLVLAPEKKIDGYDTVEIAETDLSWVIDCEKVGDLLKEVSLEISESPKFQGNISGDVVLEIILYFQLFAKKLKNLQSVLLVFYAEGFIGRPSMDLGKILRFGDTLLDELRHKEIMCYKESCLVGDLTSYEVEDIAERKLGRHYRFDKYAKLPVERDDVHRLGSFDISDMSTLTGTNFTNLVTLFIYKSSSLEIPQHAFENMKCLRVLSINKTSINSFPSSLACLGKSLKFLGLHKCETPKSLQLSCLLTGLGKLEILDLEGMKCEQYPENSFVGLQSLRHLDMSDCPNELSFPPSISCLSNLEQLILRNCKYLRVLPDQFFHQRMVSLNDVDLSSNNLLTSLPSSIFNLTNLKKLQLNHCCSLQNIIPTTPKCLFLSLEELNLRGCESLQDINHVSSTFWDMVPNLKSLDLSETPIVSLKSVKILSKLENITLESNKNLRRIDLSGINIKNFRLTEAPVLEGLAGLDIQDAKCVHKLIWRSVQGGQAEFDLDLCGNDDVSHMHIPLAEWQKHGNGSEILILVKNGNIFHPLREQHAWLRERFFVYIGPRIRPSNKETLPTQPAARRYKDIYSMRKPLMPSYEKCLEITQVKSFPNDCSVVLSQTKSFYVHDEGTIAQLSDFGVENMNELRECLIEKCQSVTDIFVRRSSTRDQTEFPILKNLEKLHISNLLKLTKLCTSNEVFLTHGSFGNLKHLCLEYCPRVVTGFSPSVCMESLEVLKIRFCPRLKEIFASRVNGEGTLDRLHTISLFELPVLESIAHSVQLASLRNAHIKGCPKLHKIPFHRDASVNCSDLSQAIIIGESEWWERLQWDNDIVKQHLHFIPWNRYRKRAA